MNPVVPAGATEKLGKNITTIQHVLLEMSFFFFKKLQCINVSFLHIFPCYAADSQYLPLCQKRTPELNMCVEMCSFEARRHKRPDIVACVFVCAETIK